MTAQLDKDGGYRGCVLKRTPVAREKQSGVFLSRTSINFAVDVVLFSLVVLLLFISAVLRLVFPPATEAAGWLLWGYGLDDWFEVQFGLQCLFTAAILLHIMLHWSWICSVALTRLCRRSTKSAQLDDGTRTLYGVGMLILTVTILGVCLAAAALTIQPPGG